MRILSANCKQVIAVLNNEVSTSTLKTPFDSFDTVFKFLISRCVFSLTNALIHRNVAFLCNQVNLLLNKAVFTAVKLTKLVSLLPTTISRMTH